MNYYQKLQEFKIKKNMEIISLCLSDIPKDKITTSDKNGKKYLSIVVDTRKSPDQFGNDLTVYLNPTKEEREAKTEKVYLGSGKTFVFENKQQTGTTVDTKNPPAEDDLPF